MFSVDIKSYFYRNDQLVNAPAPANYELVFALCNFRPIFVGGDRLKFNQTVHNQISDIFAFDSIEEQSGPLSLVEVHRGYAMIG